MANTRHQRRKKLLELIKSDPFLTDAQLSEEFQVSVATIRLDRMALNVPELRERTKDMAAKAQAKLKSMEGEEVYGELLEVELGQSGKSMLRVTSEMVFERNQIVRGHYLFAQANSLAVAVVNSPLALTHSANIRFLRPVRIDQRIIAAAEVIAKEDQKHRVKVTSFVENVLVFTAEVLVADLAFREDEYL